MSSLLCPCPEDYEIDRDELIEFLILAGIVEGFKSTTMQSMFSRGHSMLKSLEDACLLEVPVKYVKLHDLIRDMALKITSKSS